MVQKGYYSVLFLTVINFLSLVWILSHINLKVYVTEVIIVFAFLLLSAVMLFLLSRRNKGFGWSFALFFFSLNLMNVVYVFFFTKSMLLIVYAISSVLGFILSMYKLDYAATKVKIRKVKKPKIIVQDLKPKKRSVKKKAKKKVKKKKDSKKRKK